MKKDNNGEKVLRIGNVELENPFLLAPLAGITDAPMRRIARQSGAALAYSEMATRRGRAKTIPQHRFAFCSHFTTSVLEMQV